VSYSWTPKDSTLTCANCEQTTVFPTKSTLYRVTIKDSAGCVAFDELLLEVIKKRPIYIPNVFSPNDHNGVNDFFTIYGNQSAVIIKELKIFNRWGDLMFQGTNLPLNKDEAGWDGTWNGQKVEPNVFAFWATVVFIDGEEVVYKGDVTIVR
jgi:gliding motility-associated-like protein